MIRHVSFSLLYFVTAGWASGLPQASVYDSTRYFENYSGYSPEYYEDEQVRIHLRVENNDRSESSFEGGLRVLTDLKDRSQGSHLLQPVKDPKFWIVISFELKNPSAHLYARGSNVMNKPPSFHWELPEGWKVGAEEWPQPEKLQRGPFLNWIYKKSLNIRVPFFQVGQVGQMSEIKSTLPNEKGLGVLVPAVLPLILHVNWLICDRVCTPGRATLKWEWSQKLLNTGLGTLPTFHGELQPKPQSAFREILTAKFGFLFHSRGDLQMGFLVKMLCFAFLGGLLLNLMPCVFPVLSLKILSLMQLTGKARRGALRCAGFYTLGIWISFWSLAALLEAFRFFGHHLGWGFQLQSPFGVVTVAGILFLFSLNLLGIFEFQSGFTAGSHWGARRSDAAKAFWTGILATWLASPCTAPWMGASIGFALTQPSWVAFLIFTALGSGLAAPYVALCCFPGLGKYLPRAGSWMMIFKQGMGFLLLLAVLWLVWVLSFQVVPESLVLLWGMFWLLGISAWCLHHSQGRRFLRWGAWLLCIAAIGIEWVHIGRNPLSPSSLFVKVQPGSSAVSGWSSENGLVWDTFSPQKVESLRASQKKVLVDFTAAWCLSCQWNEWTTFGDAEVKKKLQESQIVLLKADWTNEDPQITWALHQLGRSGVPLYVLYLPGRPPQILPEVLSPAVLMQALLDSKKAPEGK